MHGEGLAGVQPHRGTVGQGQRDAPVFGFAGCGAQRDIGRGPARRAGRDRRAGHGGAAQAVGAADREGQAEGAGAAAQRDLAAAAAAAEAAEPGHLASQLLGDVLQRRLPDGPRFGAQPAVAGRGAEGAAERDRPGLPGAHGAGQRDRGRREGGRRAARAGGQHRRLQHAGRLVGLVRQVEPEAGGVLDLQLPSRGAGVGQAVGGARGLAGGDFRDQPIDHLVQRGDAGCHGVGKTAPAQRQRPHVARVDGAAECQLRAAVVGAAGLGRAGQAAAIALQHRGRDRELVGVQTAVARALDDGVGRTRVQRAAGASRAGVADGRVVEGEPAVGVVDVLAGGAGAGTGLADRLGGEDEGIDLALLQRHLQVVVGTLGHAGRALVEPHRPVGYRHGVGAGHRDPGTQEIVVPGVAARAAGGR